MADDDLPERHPHLLGEELVLADLVSRVLDRGVAITGDVTISVAGVDLVHLALQLRVSGVETAGAARAAPAGTGDPGAEGPEGG